MADHPTLSPYALCAVEDVSDLLGYDDEQAADRTRTIIRAINGASKAIARRAQREFLTTEAEEDQTRFFLIAPGDIRRRYVRVGDMAEVPSEITLWTPDRDESFELDPETDVIMLPAVPEAGFPWESIQVKRSVSSQLVSGWWISVKTTWGFPGGAPDEVTQIAIGTAASQILNDVAALTELARAQGRRIQMESIIPAEYIETIDTYRLWRVS